MRRSKKLVSIVEAEAHAEAINNTLRPEMATKADMAELRSELAAINRLTAGA